MAPAAPPPNRRGERFRRFPRGAFRGGLGPASAGTAALAGGRALRGRRGGLMIAGERRGQEGTGGGGERGGRKGKEKEG